MINRFSRTELLIGQESVERLKKAKIAVFGAGGVGGYAIEALARTAVGYMDIYDGDIISETNINRQIIALESMVGRYKTEVFKERIHEINPEAEINAINKFITRDNISEIDFYKYDYIIDAVDTVSAKLAIIESAKKAGVPVISSMGAGNKLDPTAFKIADISETKICPLARVMRKELSRRGISDVKVVYSEEEAITPHESEEGDTKGTAGRPTPGSIAFVPAAAGLVLASEVIRDIVERGG